MTEVSMKADFRCWTHPVVVGSGQRLVREGDATTGLRLLDREAFNAEVVVLSYQPEQPEHHAATLLFEDWRPVRSQSITELAMAMLGVPADAEFDQEP
ncbi:MAG TPA: hypothetical protein VEX37_01050 [Thermomicrobiales bacterium]|nr:hypothetical protein [Thermomicrobiales bacterium]